MCKKCTLAYEQAMCLVKLAKKKPHPRNERDEEEMLFDKTLLSPVME